MTSRDEFVENLKSSIDEWNTQIGEIETKMSSASADAQARYAEQIAEASKFRAEAQAKLADAMKISQDAWDSYRISAEAAAKDISEGFRKAWDRFS